MISSTTGLYVVVRRLCGPAQTDRISSEMGCHSQPDDRFPRARAAGGAGCRAEADVSTAARAEVTAYYHLQQLGHASRQGSVKLQQILWFLRASPEEHGMPVQGLRSQPG